MHPCFSGEPGKQTVNLNTFKLTPSFLGLAFGGILIGVALVLLLLNKPNTRLVMIVLLLSIAVSVHSILHFGEEIVYSYNPLSGL
jgi:hypothetical protein